MTASDGTVGGVTKIVDHGPDSARWNLVILGDGYRASEIATYHTDVQNFIDTMRATPPYTDLWCGINVHRVDVTSTDSGADDPTTCSGGSGATPRTYFDATFCSKWGSVNLDRLLTVNSTSAELVAKNKVPLMHQTVVVVNSSKYGGSGGKVATFSTHTQASEIAIHEIGHSAFGLADEYEDGNVAFAGEPPEPNVTRDTNRATNKWRDLILPTTPMPSSCYGDCTSGCVGPATPPAAGAVSVYEGARYNHCGMYRPLPGCYMRDYSPFCPVCARVIRQVLAPFQPAESIALTTPSISFSNIPEGVGGVGVKTYRAIVFEVVACRQLTFRITSGPGSPFGTPFGTSVTTGPASYTPIGFARLWISYTSTTAGSSASGSVKVRCDQTGQTWTIPISANTVQRPRTEVVLVLDRSGSMDEDAGDGQKKVDKLRESARIFVDAMLPGDGIGLVRFDDTVQRLMNVTDVGPLVTGGGRTTAIGHITGSALDPAGATSIGGGVQEGRNALNDGAASASPPYAVQAMVVLTDGQENTPPMLSSVAGSISANTFAIGLGLPYNISVAALNALTQGHNGYLLVTGALTTDQRTRLTKYFLQILAGITNANVVLDPHGDIGLGEEQRIPFSISETDYGMDAFVLTPAPPLLTYELESPDGTRFDAGAVSGLGTGVEVIRDGIAFYRVSLPLDPAVTTGTHAGTWHVVLRIERKPYWDRRSYVTAAHWEGQSQGRLPYDVIIHTYSNLVFSASAVQASYDPGNRVDLVATLREYDVPVGDRASVWAEITRPDGSAFSLGMGVADEQYTASFVTSIPGVYRMRIRGSGRTFEGTLFTREQTRTAVAVTGGGGGQPGESTRGDSLVDLLCCLAGNGGFDDRFLEQLKRFGIAPDVFRTCLGNFCDRQSEGKRSRLG